MNLTMPELQEKAINIFMSVKEVCEKNDITYYCTTGTVLGTVRHKGQIPWDYDIDLAIPENQIERFIECCKKDLPKEYYVDYFTVNPKGYRQFPRIALTGFGSDTLHVDIFRLIGLPDSREEQIELMNRARKATYGNKYMRRTFIQLLTHGHPVFAFNRIFNRDRYLKIFDSCCKAYEYDEATFVMNPSGRYKEKNIFEKRIFGEGVYMEYEDVEVRIPSEFDFYLKQYYGDYMQFPPQEIIDKAMNKIYEIRENRK